MRRPTRTAGTENPRVDSDGWADDHLTLMDELARKRLTAYEQDARDAAIRKAGNVKPLKPRMRHRLGGVWNVRD